MAEEEDPHFSAEETDDEEIPAEEPDDDVDSEELESEEDDEVDPKDDADEIVKKPSSEKRSRSTRSSGTKGHPIKRSRVAARHFIDMEATVGDDDDEEEDEEDDADFVREANEAQLAERELDLSQRRRINRVFESRPDTMGGSSHLASAIGKLERQFRDQTYDDDVEDENYVEYRDYEDSRADPTRFLVDIRDTKLWMINTTKGYNEKETVIAIMNKSIHMKQKGVPFDILSAFAADGIRGHIYVEAASPGHVSNCLSGLKSVQLGNIRMVPLNEVASVFTMGDKAVKSVASGQFVRFRTGIHAGDIAQVHKCDEVTSSAWVRVVPRVDFNEAITRQRDRGAGNKVPPREKSSKRSMPQIFNRDEVEAKGGEIEPGPTRGTFRFDGKLFDEFGYQLKKVSLKSLITGDAVASSVSEVKDFARRADADAEGGTLNWMSLLEGQTASVRSGTFSVGDLVIIRSGDLAGLKATVTGLEGKTAVVKPEGLQRDVTVNAGDLVKYFEVGDSVRAISGPNQGKSGLITTIDLQRSIASVYWPEQSIPFSCALDSLQQCPASGLGSGGISSLGGFSVGDLVQLSDQDTVIITRIDPGRTFSVLNTENRPDVVPLSKIASKRTNDFALANDANGLQFGIKATVALLDPLYKEMSARVCHIWKQSVFVKLSAKEASNGGYLICASKDLRVSSGDGTSFMLTQNTRQLEGARGGRIFRGRGGGGRGLRGRRVKLTGTRHKGTFGVIQSQEQGDSFRIRADVNGLTVTAHKNDFVLVDGGGYRGGGGGGGGFRGGGRGRGGYNQRNDNRGSQQTQDAKNKPETWDSYFEGVKTPW